MLFFDLQKTKQYLPKSILTLIIADIYFITCRIYEVKQHNLLIFKIFVFSFHANLLAMRKECLSQSAYNLGSGKTDLQLDLL